MKFGAYTEGIFGGYIAAGDDVWEVIGQAFDETNKGRVDAIRVGPLGELSIVDLIDEEDVLTLQEGGLTARRVLDLVSERCGERVAGGVATFRCSEREAQEALSAQEGVPARVLRWAGQYIELDPASYCDGRSPLPVEYVEGEWVYGGTEAEPAAFVVYTTAPDMETGHVGWCWWALGKMGDAPTLREAMRKAEQIVDARSAE